MTSNAHRAYESAAGKADIKDEYDEVQVLLYIHTYIHILIKRDDEVNTKDTS